MMSTETVILFEHESRVAGVRSLLTIGQRQANGARWGFNTQQTDLAAFVCDASRETNTHGEDPVGYWARYWRGLIFAQQAICNGHAALDMSGWFGAQAKGRNAERCAAYLDAVRMACGGVNLTAESMVWWNPEGLDDDEAAWFANEVWRSGVFGPARLICTGARGPKFVDGRTALIEAQLPNGVITGEIGAATLGRIQADYAKARELDLYIVAHIDTPDYDGQGRPATPARNLWNKAIIAELADANAWLVFNPAGRMNHPTQGTPADEVVQLRADAGAVGAICG